ncbi:hypothetical protein M404DRAFT_1000087 [Pisolithus tinctorius Marx 270]|uniref:Uncharacterized protein n=1 Tax=Pisolithus tinctorius Marx 270 TaxID=870435 RepID=A0A0C3K5Z2_PISTI|nr:hypothetical protein M404DRAFT_1000087 [Pisolithus tinctorius Marx 270]
MESTWIWNSAVQGSSKYEGMEAPEGHIQWWGEAEEDSYQNVVGTGDLLSAQSSQPLVVRYRQHLSILA